MLDRSDMRALALVVAAALVAYGAACGGTFVYDDHHSVRDNAAIQDLANVPAYFADVDLFSALRNRMYRPVLLTTFALNHALGGLEPLVYKLTNLLLHATCAGLLFALARRLGALRLGALCAATLFGVHPLASEAVNMVSGRSELLVTAAVLGALHCHVAAMSGRRGASIATSMCTLVACGTKETGVIVPVLLLALEVVRGGAAPGAWASVRRALPSIGAVLAYLVVRSLLLGTVTVAAPSWDGGADPQTGAGRGLATQLATMAVVLPRCLGLLVVPAGLSLDPPIAFTRDFASWPVIGGIAAVAALAAVGLARPRRAPLAFLGTALALSGSLPWIIVPLNVPLAEHRLYGFLAGSALVAVGWWPRRARAQRPLGAAAAVAIAAFAFLAAERSLLYRDELALWQRTHALNPNSYRACYSIGACLMNQGRLDEARSWTEQALALYPDYVSARRNLAEIHLQLDRHGDPAVAAAMGRWLVAREPRNPFHLLLLSRALAALGERGGRAELFDEAVAVALRANDVAAPKGLVYRTAASARRLQGRLEEALALLDESVARGLDHSSVLLDRCEVLIALSRPQAALADLRRAIVIDPFDPRAARALARMRAAAPR